MNPDYKAKYFTLDWDNISIDEARNRFYELCESDDISEAHLALSGTKGFHVRCHTRNTIIVANLRRKWKDDGRRLVNDILNRDGNVHDILWTRKTVHGITWEEKPLLTMKRLR